MNRLICLHFPNQPITINGFEPLSIDKLDSLVNYSIDHIFCPILELYKKEHVDNLLPVILNKIRPEGLLTTQTTNMHQVCRDYYLGSMKDDTLISIILNKNSILSQPYLENTIQASGDFRVVKIESPDKLSLYITSQRTKI